MHTSCYESCRIHHNGDYSGDIVITNKDSTSVTVGERATITYSSQALVSNFFIDRKKYSDKIPVNKTIIIEGDPGSENSKIEVLLLDIECFVEDFIADKIIEKLESAVLSVSDLKGIADILKIELP